MKTALKAIVFLILIYTLIFKSIYSFFYFGFLDYKGSNLVIHLSNLLTLIILVFTILFYFTQLPFTFPLKKVSKVIFSFTLLFVLFTQLFLNFLDALTMNTNLVDPDEFLITTTIPNLLFVILNIFLLIYFNFSKKKSTKILSPQKD